MVRGHVTMVSGVAMWRAPETKELNAVLRRKKGLRRQAAMFWKKKKEANDPRKWQTRKACKKPMPLFSWLHIEGCMGIKKVGTTDMGFGEMITDFFFCVTDCLRSAPCLREILGY